MHTLKDFRWFIPATIIVALLGCCFGNEHSELLQGYIDRGEELPHGVYTIDTPLHTAKQKSCSSIVGQGTPSITKPQFWTGRGTYIIWGGADDAETMIEFESCDSDLSHVTLDANDKAKFCVLFFKRWNSSGIYAPGSNSTKRLYCRNAKVAGVCFGRTSYDHHCDEWEVDFYQTHRNPRGVLVRNAMSMGHVIRHLHSSETECDIEYQAGGYLRLDTVTRLHSGTVLRINEKKHPDGRATIGSGNRIYVVGTVKGDAQATEVQLLDMQTPTKANVTFGPTLLAKPSNKLLTMRGPCAVTINGMDQPIKAGSLTAIETRQGFPISLCSAATHQQPHRKCLPPAVCSH